MPLQTGAPRDEQLAACQGTWALLPCSQEGVRLQDSSGDGGVGGLAAAATATPHLPLVLLTVLSQCPEKRQWEQLCKGSLHQARFRQLSIMLSCCIMLLQLSITCRKEAKKKARKQPFPWPASGSIRQSADDASGPLQLTVVNRFIIHKISLIPV